MSVQQDTQLCRTLLCMWMFVAVSGLLLEGAGVGSRSLGSLVAEEMMMILKGWSADMAVIQDVLVTAQGGGMQG